MIVAPRRAGGGAGGAAGAAGAGGAVAGRSARSTAPACDDGPPAARRSRLRRGCRRCPPSAAAPAAAGCRNRRSEAGRSGTGIVLDARLDLLDHRPRAGRAQRVGRPDAARRGGARAAGARLRAPRAGCGACSVVHDDFAGRGQLLALQDGLQDVRLDLPASSPSTRTPIERSLKTRSWWAIPIIVARSWTRILLPHALWLPRVRATGSGRRTPLGSLPLRSAASPPALSLAAASASSASARLGRSDLLEGARQRRHEVLVAHRRGGAAARASRGDGWRPRRPRLRCRAARPASSPVHEVAGLRADAFDLLQSAPRSAVEQRFCTVS